MNVFRRTTSWKFCSYMFCSIFCCSLNMDPHTYQCRRNRSQKVYNLFTVVYRHLKGSIKRTFFHNAYFFSLDKLLTVALVRNTEVLNTLGRTFFIRDCVSTLWMWKSDKHRKDMRRAEVKKTFLPLGLEWCPKPILFFRKNKHWYIAIYYCETNPSGIGN